jgi:molybdate transport system substrate-binding protein
MRASLASRLCAALFAIIAAGVFAAIPAHADDLKVFAAASLKDALEEVGKRHSDAPNRPKVVSSFAASSALAKQIENGAPADIFISADEDWMDYVAQRKLIDPVTRVDLLGNRLVLIAPAGATACTAA